MLVLGWIVCAIISAVIGQRKKMGGGAGFLWGLLLGIIGLIIVAVSAEKEPNIILVSGDSSKPIQNADKLVDEVNKAVFKDQKERAVEILQDALYTCNNTSDPFAKESSSLRNVIYQKLRELGKDDLIEKYKGIETDLYNRHIETQKIERAKAEKAKRKDRMQTLLIIAIMVAIFLAAYLYQILK